MSDGYIDGDNIICGVHGWDYRLDSGVSEYNNSETLPKFSAWIEDGQVMVDEDEIAAWAAQHPQPYQRDTYQGAYQDPTGTADEPHVKFIRKLANEGLSKVGHHGPSSAMGVPRGSLPTWDDLQFVTAQLARPRVQRPGAEPDLALLSAVSSPRPRPPQHRLRPRP